jgi:molybdopterin/thiamine biosynthesis adenylyltransferase/rhodanese-related sulfurtransferase
MQNFDNASIGTELTHDEILRYSRHLLMPEVGLEGQQRLKTSSVIILGTGGLGSSVSMYLAAAGVGRIGLVDYDVVDFTNLQRQIVHGTSTIGERKVVSAQERLRDINPTIQIDIYDEPYTSENAFQISEPYDLLIDCTDNFPTRYLSNDVAVLTGKPNVYGSIYRFEGQVSVFWAKEGPCYRCLFPEPPPPGLVPSCSDAGVFGVLPGTIGTLQATEAIKLLLGIGEPLIGKLLIYDALTMSFEELRLKKNPKCRICSDSPAITDLIDYEEFCGVPAHDLEEHRLSSEWEIEPSEVAEKLNRGEKLRLIDVREPHELKISKIETAQLIPLGSLASERHTLNSAEEIILICKSGSRSARALEILASAGFKKLKNMRGGLNAWSEQVDSSLPRY